MPRIAYYVSSHGFGHAARQQAVINRLGTSEVEIYVRSATPAKFFKAAKHHHSQRYDIGIIQANALEMDIEASLKWMVEFLDEQEALITQELAFIREKNIDLVVSDMPPIAVEIAARAGVPSIVLTHFTWDWVYGHYMDDFPQYAYIVDILQEQYAKTTLALQMQVPIPHPFEPFPVIEPVGLIHNTASKSRAEIRAEFNIPDDRVMVVLSMGGHGWGNSQIKALKAIDQAIFLVMPGAWEQVKDMPERFRRVPVEYDNYHNLIARADLVAGKAGGSTIAEVIGHRTPMIYTVVGEEQWRETGLLVDTMGRYASAEYVPMQAFIAGEWVSLVQEMLAKDHQWPEVNRNGVQEAVKHIMELLDSQSL